MTVVRVTGVGAVGVNKDLSQHELPTQAWTDANNIRFVDGAAAQALGYKELYPSAAVVPLHVMPLNVLGARAWLYAGAGKIFKVVNGPVHTNITRQSGGADVDYTALPNAWTSCLLGGVPILNNGVDAPQQWLLTDRASALSAWPANTACAAMRVYKNALIALNITKAGVNYPFMVKWSHPADPGSVPSTWDVADPTKDAGENDLSEGYDKIVDGLTLRDSFMIYKESSIWRMDYTGGPLVYRFQKVQGASGALARNCIAELDGQHFVFSSSDCIVHDGQTSSSVLDRLTRRAMFREINADRTDQCFVFVNRLYNEVFACYPSLGATACDRAMVWNWVDKTVTFRDLPNLHHAASGAVDDASGSTWDADSGAWDDDSSVWDSSSTGLTRTLSVMAGDGQKLYLLDSGAQFDGTPARARLERVGLSFGAPEKVKLVSRIRPRLHGSAGGTVLVSVGFSADPYSGVTWNPPVPFVLGSSLSVDSFVSGRYIAVKFETGTASMWRLDSYDIDVVETGSF